MVKAIYSLHCVHLGWFPVMEVITYSLLNHYLMHMNQ